MTTLKDLHKGDYFTIKETPTPTETQVYIKGDYDRQTKSFSCICYGDINKEKFLKSNKKVFIDFTF